jgi:Na+/phosphate symporter
MNETWEEVLHQLHKTGNCMADCLRLLQKAFINESLDVLKDCRSKLVTIRSGEPELTKKMKRFAKADREKEAYLAIPLHFIRICDSLELLTDTFEKKIRENILFSDRAITEISFVSQTMLDMLKAAADIILVKNQILLRYVIESEASLKDLVIKYSTLHEERLVEGLCLPIATPLYLNILDAVSVISREAKAIAEEIPR